jgi:periplasmic protein TonB
MGVSPADARVRFLNDCLVEGDSAQEKRVRRNKQRALVISIVVQILIVVALVLYPLFTRGENIAARVVVLPAVPYSPGRPHTTGRTPTQPPHGHGQVCRFCAPPRIPPTIITTDRGPVSEPIGDDGPEIPGAPVGQFIPGAPTSFDTHNEAPAPPMPHKTERLRVSGSVIEAKLVRRVEPEYPPLAVSIRREGRVELHAIIATDGSIQSLEVVQGDALFIGSALAAVRQWRYQPTLLNGQPIEVDTHITVIYSLTR